MNDLISRKAAINTIKNHYCDGCTYYGVKCKSVLSENCPIYNASIAIGAVPAVDAEPVRHGRWIYLNESVFPDYACSLCGCISIFVADAKYCPRCGAKMDLEDDE